MQTYNYELGPVHSRDRKDNERKLVTGQLRAVNYGTATQLASAKAAELSKGRKDEYGVVRIW